MQAPAAQRINLRREGPTISSHRAQGTKVQYHSNCKKPRAPVQHMRVKQRQLSVMMQQHNVMALLKVDLQAHSRHRAQLSSS